MGIRLDELENGKDNPRLTMKPEGHETPVGYVSYRESEDGELEAYMNMRAVGLKEDYSLGKISYSEDKGQLVDRMKDAYEEHSKDHEDFVKYSRYLESPAFRKLSELINEHKEVVLNGTADERRRYKNKLDDLKVMIDLDKEKDDTFG